MTTATADAGLKPLIDLIPGRYETVRRALENPENEGHTLLLALMDHLSAGKITLEDLRLTSVGRLDEEMTFMNKLRAISLYGVIVNARNGRYSLEEQVEDFLLFGDIESMKLHQGMVRMRRAALQMVLLAIRTEGQMKDQGIITTDYSLPIDVLVAIGDDAARWHAGLAAMPGDHAEPVGESQILDYLESTLKDTYNQLQDYLMVLHMRVAMDKIRQKFGLPALRVL